MGSGRLDWMDPVSPWWWAAIAAFLVAAVVFFIRGSHAQPSWTPADTAKSESTATRGSYPYRVARALDVFLNVLTLGRECETISTRCWRWSLRPHGRLFSKALTRVLYGIQKNHGPGAATGDEGRAEAEAAFLAPIIDAFQSSEAP